MSEVFTIAFAALCALAVFAWLTFLPAVGLLYLVGAL